MVRCMTKEDYPQVEELWNSVEGFRIRRIDDSQDGINRFLSRNPGLSVVDEEDGKIVGSVLCGEDGRTAVLYHVCVKELFRRYGIGKQMVDEVLRLLKDKGINSAALVAFSQNQGGNLFWKSMGWKPRSDLNCYDYILNPLNIVHCID